MSSISLSSDDTEPISELTGKSSTKSNWDGVDVHVSVRREGGGEGQGAETITFRFPDGNNRACWLHIFNNLVAQNSQERPFVDRAKLLDLSDLASNLSALWTGRRRESTGSEKSVRKALAKQGSPSALGNPNRDSKDNLLATGSGKGSGNGKKDSARFLPAAGWQQQADNDRAIAQLKQNLQKALER